MLDKPISPDSVDYSWDEAVDWHYSQDKILVIVEPSMVTDYDGSCAVEGDTVRIEGTVYKVLTATHFDNYSLLDVLTK